MALSLAGKTAIVTGAGSGINLAFASSLLSRHCNVVFADLALRPEAKEIVAQHSSSSRAPAKAVFQKTDVRQWQDLAYMFRVADRSFGGADIVCPGAGVYEPLWSSFWYPPGKPPSTDSLEHSRYAELDINLVHPIRTTQLAISHFLNPSDASKRLVASPANPRSIIHISSVAGQVAVLVAPMYIATKHAINGFVRSLAPLDKELGIRVTAVAPGVIKTPLWTDAPEKLKLVTEKDEWVTPKFVAEQMTNLVEREEIEVQAPSATATGTSSTRMAKVEGGFILEVGKKLRKVEAFNDPGPSRDGNTVTGLEAADKEIFERLRQGGWGQ
ncbi:hypothetical protein MMC26_005476 [Xylographa opegraphella]|nr:hypothetical protein [Xylographa opegraphella]